MSQAEASDDGLARALVAVGDRWSLEVVAAIAAGALRFGDIARCVAGIAPNILTTRLRSLEHAGLVIARPYSERPVRMQYELTARGAALDQVIDALRAWGIPATDTALHDVCGTALRTARWWCPTCAVPVHQAADEGGEFA